MALDGPTALITGGCGFVGVNLGRLLVDRGWRLVAFDNLSTGKKQDALDAGFSEVIIGDVRDANALRRAAEGADYMVHLAAHTNVVESIEDPANDVEVNVQGVLNALMAASDADLSGFVFASSNAPLGEVDPPTHEGIVARPVSPYGASKLAGEALCSAFAGSYCLPTTVLRFSNVYGPYSYHKGSVVAKFLKHLYASEPLVVYGDGEQTRDYVYIDDLCTGIALALESGLQGEVFHLGSGTETSILELIELLRVDFDGFDVTFEPARAGEIMRNYSDISKARRLLGFEPQVDLVTGLRKTKDWFDKVMSP